MYVTSSLYNQPFNDILFYLRELVSEYFQCPWSQMKFTIPNSPLLGIVKYFVIST